MAPQPTTTGPAVSAGASPEEVVRAFLEAARKAQHVRALGVRTKADAGAYDTAMAEVRSLAAEQEIFKQIKGARPPNLPHDSTQDEVVQKVTESWVSILAHYVDGLLLDTLRTLNPVGAGGSVATAFVEAERADEAERLLVLRESQDLRQARDGKGEPLGTQSGAGLDMLRKAGLEGMPPIFPPIRARFEINLVQENANWRIAGLTVGPARAAAPVPLETMRPRQPLSATTSMSTATTLPSPAP